MKRKKWNLFYFSCLYNIRNAEIRNKSDSLSQFVACLVMFFACWVM